MTILIIWHIMVIIRWPAFAIFPAVLPKHFGDASLLVVTFEVCWLLNSVLDRGLFVIRILYACQNWASRRSLFRFWSLQEYRQKCSENLVIVQQFRLDISNIQLQTFDCKISANLKQSQNFRFIRLICQQIIDGNRLNKRNAKSVVAVWN